MKYCWDYLNKNTYNNRIGKYKFAREYSFILKHGKNYFTKILDVAGGSGRFSIPLLEYSKSITLLELQEEAVNLLKSRTDKINAICGGFLETQIDGQFTLVVCVEAIQYFHDKNKFVEKVKSLVEKDGLFIFTTVNPSSWRFLLWKLRHRRKGDHIKLSELKKILNENNFEIQAIEGFNWIPLPLTSNNFLADIFVFIEKVFGLKYWINQSPWVLLATKNKG